MTNIKLSPRLLAIASYVPRGEILADVGCDHGWLGLKLLSEGKIPSLIGMDLREGPLEGAKRHAEDAGLMEFAEFRLSDGLDAFSPGEAGTLVIAGMGGQMMAGILLREPAKTESFSVIIAEPQKDHALVRRALRERGFSITDEQMVVECGKFYPVIRAEKKRAEERNVLSDVSQTEDEYGPILIRKKDPVLREYLEKRRTLIHNMLEGMQWTEDPETVNKRRSFEKEYEDIAALLSYYNKAAD